MSWCIRRNPNVGKARTSLFLSKMNYQSSNPLEHNRKIFRSVCVKPFPLSPKHQHCVEPGCCKSTNDIHCPNHTTGEIGEERSYIVYSDENEDLGDGPPKLLVEAGTKEEEMFSKPRRDELEGLLMNLTFKRIQISDVLNLSLIFNVRFVDEMERASEGLRKKTRFVAQHYAGEGKS